MPDLLGAVCPTAPDSSSGATDGSRHLPVKPAKLDATALHDDTLANSVPPSEVCNHAGISVPSAAGHIFHGLAHIVLLGDAQAAG